MAAAISPGSRPASDAGHSVHRCPDSEASRASNNAKSSSHDASRSQNASNAPRTKGLWAHCCKNRSTANRRTAERTSRTACGLSCPSGKTGTSIKSRGCSSPSRSSPSKHNSSGSPANSERAPALEAPQPAFSPAADSGTNHTRCPISTSACNHSIACGPNSPCPKRPGSCAGSSVNPLERKGANMGQSRVATGGRPLHVLHNGAHLTGQP